MIRNTLILLLKLLLICFAVQACQRSDDPKQSVLNCQERNSVTYTPANDLGELFTEVQLSGLFPDSKTFPDCGLLFHPDTILLHYLSKKDFEADELIRFIDTCFYCNTHYNQEINSIHEASLEDHLHQHWDYLTRMPGDDSLLSSLLPLTKPYVVPGGRFREIYYWDSYFTMEGLAASGRLDLIENMLDNFACLIEQYGHIPNGNRSYYLSRSQPPFYAEMIKLFMREKGDKYGVKYLSALLQEYHYWMDTNGSRNYRRLVMIDGQSMNRYWDDQVQPRTESYSEDLKLGETLPKELRSNFYRNVRAACESGWDFSSRWFSDSSSINSIQTTNILPVDLNCLIYNMEETIAILYRLKGDEDSAGIFQLVADQRKEMIHELFWDSKTEFFYDYNFIRSELSFQPTLAGVYPLYFGIADSLQARKIAKTLEEKFLFDGGLVSTLNNTGQQWDAPNGWAPLQWMAIKGLKRYGHDELAQIITFRWMQLNERVYRQTGKMMEKYNVVDMSLFAGGGEYVLQDGFGWTNGVYLGLWRERKPE